MAEAASSAAAKAAVVSAVASAASAPSAAGTGASATSSSSGCLICLDDVVPEDVVVLQPCGHVLCTGCMGSYLSAEVWAYSPPWLSVLLQVNDGRTQIRCPKTDCRSDLPFAQLQQYLDRLLLDKYERYALATYLRTNPNVRMCPGVGCDYAVVRDKKPMYPDGLWTDTGTQCKQTGGRAKVADEGQDERHVGRAVGPGHRDRPAAVVFIATLSCTFSALIPFVCLTGWSF